MEAKQQLNEQRTRRRIINAAPPTPKVGIDRKEGFGLPFFIGHQTQLDGQTQNCGASEARCAALAARHTQTGIAIASRRAHTLLMARWLLVVKQPPRWWVRILIPTVKLMHRMSGGERLA